MDRAGKGIRLNSQKRCELGEMPKVLALCELKGIELRNSPTLLRRAAQLGPAIQVWDALSRNVSKLLAEVEILLANCLAHGRRQFVEVAGNFPVQCRYVVESLGEVYGHDAEAHKCGLTPEERLQFHQAHSGPVMECNCLHDFDDRLTPRPDGADCTNGNERVLFLADR